MFLQLFWGLCIYFLTVCRAKYLDESNEVFYFNRAGAFIKLEQYDLALRDCLIAIQFQPSYARAYGHMGSTYTKLNLYANAVVCFKKALELKSNYKYQKKLEASQHMMLQDDPTAQAEVAASLNLQNFLKNPNLINIGSHILQIKSSIIQPFQGENAPSATEGAGRGGMESSLQMVQPIAQQIQNSDSVDQLKVRPRNDPSSNGPILYDRMPGFLE